MHHITKTKHEEHKIMGDGDSSNGDDNGMNNVDAVHCSLVLRNGVGDCEVYSDDNCECDVEKLGDGDGDGDVDGDGDGNGDCDCDDGEGFVRNDVRMLQLFE